MHSFLYTEENSLGHTANLPITDDLLKAYDSLINLEFVDAHFLIMLNLKNDRIIVKHWAVGLNGLGCK